MRTSPLFWAATLAILTFAAYSIGHVRTAGNFELYAAVPAAATVFGVVLNAILMFKVFSTDDADLGKLAGEKTTIVLGILFTLFFGSIQVLIAFDAVF